MSFITELAQKHHKNGLLTIEDLVKFGEAVVAAEQERICTAIKTEDDYCCDEGNYMLDSNDCILVVQGKWERPDYSGNEVKRKERRFLS